MTIPIQQLLETHIIYIIPIDISSKSSISYIFHPDLINKEPLLY